MENKVTQLVGSKIGTEIGTHDLSVVSSAPFSGTLYIPAAVVFLIIKL